MALDDEIKIFKGKTAKTKDAHTGGGLSGGRGSSVHFKNVASGLGAVAHASREVEPSYLLPKEHSLGAHVVIDDDGEVKKTLEHKMAIASRQAKTIKDYSPLWEGVINLPEPKFFENKSNLYALDLLQKKEIDNHKTIVSKWVTEYEKLTGHKVLRADVHLDEGYMDEQGKPKFNAHAHVIVDRTDDKGRVIRLDRTRLRAVQDMTASTTGLARGEDAAQSKRRHVEHQAYRYLAQKGRLNPDLRRERAEARAITLEAEKTALRAEIDLLKAQYAKERQALIDSHQATQADYKALKALYNEALEELQQAKEANPTTVASNDMLISGMYEASGILQDQGVSKDAIKSILTDKHGSAAVEAYYKMSDSDFDKALKNGDSLRGVAKEITEQAIQAKGRRH